MARRKGSIDLDSNLELLADAPLDARSVVAAKSDLTASGTFGYTYVGMVVTVAEEGKLYVLKGKPYTNIDNWKAVDSSTKAYAQNTKYNQNDLVYVGDVLRRVVIEYVSDNTQGTIDDSFNLDYINGKLGAITESIEVPICLGSIKTDNSGDFPQNPIEGNWVLIENCVNTAPDQAGIGVYSETHGWNVLAIPSAPFIFPEPLNDGRLYFRQRDLGATNGQWTAFSTVDGNTVEVNIKTLRDTVDGNIIPKARELVWDSDRGILVIGDGVTRLGNLRKFYATEITSQDIITALGFTPENSANKGQPFGYAPLDGNAKVPAANLPDVVTNTYSKTEVDHLIQNALNDAEALVNSEASTARANEQDIADDLSLHTSNTVIHVTQNNKDAWDAKVDATDLAIYDTHIGTAAIHVTQSEKDKWNGMNAAYYVTNKDDLPTTGISVGNIGYVQTSAPGVTPIVVDQYMWTGSDWELYEQGQTSLTIPWGNITGKPSSTPLSIDSAVSSQHTHSNSIALSKIGQNSAGNFTYDGVEIGAKVIFYNNNNELPSSGDADTLYVIYEDTRVRSYPSISVYRDGTFQILGRGLQESAPTIGELSVYQAEYYGVTANSTYKIIKTPDQYFCSMPLEILKEVAGATNVTRTVLDLSNPDNFDYKKDILSIDSTNKLRITIDDYPTTIDTYSDYYYSSVDIDISYFKDVDNIE